MGKLFKNENKKIMLSIQISLQVGFMTVIEVQRSINSGGSLFDGYHINDMFMIIGES